MKINLEAMSREELETLKQGVNKALATLDQRRKADARKAAEEAVRQFGFSLDEVMGGKGKGSKSSGGAKYRNPADPTQTWTGRGRQPGWIKEGLAAGKSLDYFAI